MTKRKTTEDFIKRAREVHGDKYDYSKVNYIKNNIKVCIICPIHGEFWQEPNNHLQGQECPLCSKEKSNKQQRLTTEEFIKRAKEVHGDKYDYSKVEYINTDIKVCIICPIHGEFWQTPYKHIKRRQGCPSCSHKNMNTEDFIKLAKEVHGDKYDYSKVEYKGSKEKICIICPIHGEFWQISANHLYGNGCPKCRTEKLSKINSMTQEEFLERAKEVHGSKYDYTKVEYKGYNTKICIICPTHGEFWQTPHVHLRGGGCSKCFEEKKKILYNLTTEEFIKKAKEVHGDKYDYSKVNYINNRTKVCIICPIHGEFWQAPEHHLLGNGCPNCKESKLENELNNFLNENDIRVERQKKFDWLGKQSLDFYLPQYNCAIECQGVQHFDKVRFGGISKDDAEILLIQTKIRDERKRKLCEEHEVRLLYYSNLGIDYPYEVFEDKDKLLKEIKGEN